MPVQRFNLLSAPRLPVFVAMGIIAVCSVVATVGCSTSASTSMPEAADRSIDGGSTIPTGGASSALPTDAAERSADTGNGDAQADGAPTDSIPSNSDPLSLELAGANAPEHLSELISSVGRGVSYDYTPLRDPGHALAASDIIVAGYLVDIVPGAFITSTRTIEPRTEQEVQEALAYIDYALEHAEEQGLLTQEFQEEMERARRHHIQNKVPIDSEPERYVAFRVHVTEALHGNADVGAVLDLNLFHYVGMLTVDEMANILESVGRPPRVVVGASWWTPAEDWRVMHSADGAPVDQALFPHVDLFWIDGATWDPADETISQEKPGPHSEAFYLDGLHDMEPGWGELDTLDDLAETLRAAVSMQ